MDPGAFSFKIAHLSDLHFSKVNKGMLQFFSKQWIGNLNLLVHRRKVLSNTQPFSIIPHLKEHGVKHVVISGDLTTTSFEQEFHLANAFLKELKDIGCIVYLVPGNHDSYTRKAHRKKVFFNHFENPPASVEGFSLRHEQVEAYELHPKLWIVSIDTAYPSSVFHSTGRYLNSTDKHLRALLEKLPKDATILLVNHFPLFQYESPRRSLKGADKLQALVKEYPQVKLYLHGHTHRLCFANLRESGFPIVLDSGSLSHIAKGSWNLLTINQDNVSAQVFHQTKPSEQSSEDFQWTCLHTKEAKL